MILQKSYQAVIIQHQHKDNNLTVILSELDGLDLPLV